MSSTLITHPSMIPSVEDSVLAYGHFDTIHAGHIRYLKHAKTLGKVLYVALRCDPDPRIKRFNFNQIERAEALSELEIVDHIILLPTNDLNMTLANLRPKYLVLGDKARLKDILNDISETASSIETTIVFHAGDKHYASADLLSSNIFDLSAQRRSIFQKTCYRHNLGCDTLISSLDKFRTARLAVIGDTIVDQFAACEALGMSAEAPVIVVRELEKKNFIGAAAVVAAHVRSLGAHCDLISVVGTDQISGFVKDYLMQNNIGSYLIDDSSRPTTFKKRYLVENQKLFRVTRLEDHSVDREIENKLISSLNKVAPYIDGLIVSDFVYGVITPRVLESINTLAGKYGFLLFGDVQCSTQVGSISRLKEYSLLCPNEREARIALQDKDSGLEQLSYKLMEQAKINRLVMKLGSEGFIAYHKISDSNIISQPFPALSTNPVDLSGAGDSLLAVLSTSLCSGIPLIEASALACCTASLAVESMGNIPIDSIDLKKRIFDSFSTN